MATPEITGQVNQLLDDSGYVRFVEAVYPTAIWDINIDPDEAIADPHHDNGGLTETIVFRVCGIDNYQVAHETRSRPRLDRESVDVVQERDVSEIEIVAFAIAARRDSKNISAEPPSIVRQIDRYAEDMLRQRVMDLNKLLGRLHGPEDGLEKPKRGKRK